MLPAVTILVVDDDPLLLQALTAALSSPAWNVVSCASSRDALRNLGSEPYAALLVDALPGFESVVSEFRKRNPHSPIVVFTGGLSDETEKRVQEAGANLVLLKPVAFSVLRQHLQDLISVAAQKALSISIFDVELRDVMDIERRLVTANVAGDLETLDELLSDEYVFAFGSLKETKRDRLQALRLGHLRYHNLEPLHVEGKHYADLCIITGTFRIVGERDGKDISGVYRSLRIYGRKRGQWKALAGQISPKDKRAAVRLNA
ncbi:MAG: response regulator [Terriglobales bacterium]